MHERKTVSYQHYIKYVITPVKTMIKLNFNTIN